MNFSGDISITSTSAVALDRLLDLRWKQESKMRQLAIYGREGDICHVGPLI